MCAACARFYNFVQLALLVGGYAASPWLFSELKARLADMEMHMSRPDSHTCVVMPPAKRNGLEYSLQKQSSRRRRGFVLSD